MKPNTSRTREREINEVNVGFRYTQPNLPLKIAIILNVISRSIYKIDRLILSKSG
jgi:hypothetical protein